MWWKFLRHRAAVVAGVVVILPYMCALFSDFIFPLILTSGRETLRTAAVDKIRR